VLTWSGAIARLALLALLAALGSGCLRPRATSVPIPTLRFPAPAGPQKCLVVLLPGRRDRPADFESLLRASGAACDAVAVDAHMGYYMERSVVERLHTDVIAPARAQGYEQVWLAGISIGGLGSLLYLRDHSEEVAGAMLIAPYLGEPEVIEEVAAAGGLARWRPPDAVADADYGRQLWSWLHRAYIEPEPGPRPRSESESGPAPGKSRLPPVYLGYGTGDDFARANGLLAAVLPRERVFTAPGGHDWPPWRAVWKNFLASGALPGNHSPSAPATSQHGG
jgi:pimeloyl-ACP methyl ester carboxylesterase